MTVVPGDVSVEADVARVVAAGIEAHGAIDVLVNNAGVSDLRGVAPEQFDMETWNRILAVDLNGAFMYMREVGRHMLGRAADRSSTSARSWATAPTSST